MPCRPHLEALRTQGLVLLERAHELFARAAEAWRQLSRGPAGRRVEKIWRLPATRSFRRAAPWAVSIVGGAFLVLSLAVAVMASRQHDAVGLMPLARSDCPSRVYAQPTFLAPGDRVALDEITARLDEARYRVADRRIGPGTYWRDGDRLSVGLRADPAPTEYTPLGDGQRLDVITADGRIESLLLDGTPVEDPVRLAPPLLASLRSDSLVECRPVRHQELPRHAVRAIMAAEDAEFFSHGGVSIPGIVRAAWVNFRSGEIRQGGSTLTQQLVKNLYLTPERSFRRKAQEALMALAVEIRHDKDDILTAYLNHAYWGRRGSIEIVGIGAAAHSWLGKDARELDVADSALLAAIIRSPGQYHPVHHPDRTRARRDSILENMRANGWIDDPTLRHALEAPLAIVEPDPETPIAPHFVRWIEGEARRRFGVELAGAGMEVFTTLRLEDQRHATAAVAEHLADLDRGEMRLESALVSLEPTTGAVLAYVGGREWPASRFDRASRSRRQLGSAFKPLVYAAALEHRIAGREDTVRDAPVLVAYGDDYWLPRNSDLSYRGSVTVQRALEMSLNVPTTRLALATGLDRIRDLAASFGVVEDRAEAVPSLALGTAEASPLQLAQVYAAFAAEGRLPDAHGIVAIYDRDSEPLSGELVERPRRVLHPRTAGAMTEMLQGVVRSGTGYGVRSGGLRDPVAGKTGTSDDQRDAWFAGFSPDRVTVVWVGRDDNRDTGYYGAQAALPMWTRFMLDVRPRGGYADWKRSGDDTDLRHGSSDELIAAVLRPDRSSVYASHVLAPYEVEPEARTTYRGTRPRNWRQHARIVEIANQGPDSTEEPTYVPTDPWSVFQRILERLRPSSILLGEARLYEIPEGLSLPCAIAGQAEIEGRACAEETASTRSSG